MFTTYTDVQFEFTMSAIIALAFLGVIVSYFLYDIPKKDTSVFKRVFHKLFGYKVIISVQGLNDIERRCWLSEDGTVRAYTWKDNDQCRQVVLNADGCIRGLLGDRTGTWSIKE